MKFFAVLFDLDGTLLDTLDDIADSMNAVLERHGFPPHPVERYKKYVGGGIVELTRRAVPDGYKDGRVGELSAQMREQYSLHWKNKTIRYPGVDRMLDGLTSRGFASRSFQTSRMILRKRCAGIFSAHGSLKLLRGPPRHS